MAKHTQTQAQAISQMAEALHQYNRGVLAMLGEQRLAEDHESACSTVAMLCATRDEVIPVNEYLLENLDLSTEAKAAQDELNAAITAQLAAWKPIQALIDEAREELAAADPFGQHI